MKHHYHAHGGAFVFFILLSFFIISCNPDDDPQLTFPATYKYSNLAFKPSQFFVLTNNGYTEIAPAGFYASFDSLFKDSGFLEVTETEFPFESVELLNETQANVTFFDFVNYPVSSLLSDYSFNETSGEFVLVGLTDTFALSFSNDYLSAEFPLFSTHFADAQSDGTVDYSPLDTNYGIPDVPAVIAELRERWNLSAGDTVAVNVSGYTYTKQ
jgi:hypothetical protein